MGRYPAGVGRKARGDFYAGSTDEKMVVIFAGARVGSVAGGGADRLLHTPGTQRAAIIE